MRLRSHLKGKVRERNRKTTLHSGLFLAEDKRKIEKGEYDEDNSSRELDNLISSLPKVRRTL